MMLTTTKVLAVKRVENHLPYLVYTPPYPRRLATVSHCKSVPELNTGKLILESWSSCCPQKDFPVWKPAGAAGLSRYLPPAGRTKLRMEKLFKHHDLQAGILK